MFIRNIILVSNNLSNYEKRVKNKKIFLKILFMLKKKLLIFDINYDIFKSSIYCSILHLLITNIILYYLTSNSQTLLTIVHIKKNFLHIFFLRV